MSEKQWNGARILSAPIDEGSFGPGRAELGFKSLSDVRAALTAFFGGTGALPSVSDVLLRRYSERIPKKRI
jgi:hypothetical protein